MKNRTMNAGIIAANKPYVTKSYLEILTEQNPTFIERGARLWRTVRSCLIAFCAATARNIETVWATLRSTSRTALLRAHKSITTTSSAIIRTTTTLIDSILNSIDDVISFLIRILFSPTKSGLTSKLGKFVKGAVAGALIYAGAIAPQKANADLIGIANVSGSTGIGTSTMNLRNQVGGSIGGDVGDVRWSVYGLPDGVIQGQSWLRVYSDQNNQYYNRTDLALQRDNRPFDGADANQPYPLILDTQGTVAGLQLTGSRVQFQLQSPIDAGREFYNWTMLLTQGVTFADGTTQKSGSWNLNASSTYDLPSVVGPSEGNITGAYGFLDMIPSNIPEPSTTGLIIGGIAAAAALRRRKLRRSGVASA